MSGVNELLNEYSTCTKTLIASAFVVTHCSVDTLNDNKILKELKTLYVSNLVKIFVDLY